jgi:hypothetical protein
MGERRNKKKVMKLVNICKQKEDGKEQKDIRKKETSLPSLNRTKDLPMTTKLIPLQSDALAN